MGLQIHTAFLLCSLSRQRSVFQGGITINRDRNRLCCRNLITPVLYYQPEKTHTDVLSDARPTCYKKESKMKATLLKKIIVLFNIHVL
ncbi:unnamed protein product [Lactuca virosa]|uniref:Secreted protein n=1 Tax=Lactuca virosa TaxID=75947 RepID=A0AAU9P2V3_9ASTR|nr:unnamed protein product [Lactuca virosa]